MSRNVEKAQSALNRFQEQQKRDSGVLESNPSLRPKFVQSVESLPQAEKWRAVVMSEISVRLTRIQDVMASEQQIRDLNDELNKLFREKRAWEYHIKKLGGPDYISYGGSLLHTGQTVNDSTDKSYRYFGRARELPDVKEMIEQQQKRESSLKQRADEAARSSKEHQQRLERIDPSYYTYNGGLYVHRTTVDDIRRELNEALGRDFEPQNTQYHSQAIIEDEVTQTLRANKIALTKRIKKESSGNGEASDDFNFDFDDIPTSEEVTQYLVEKKKQELLKRLR